MAREKEKSEKWERGGMTSVIVYYFSILVATKTKGFLLLFAFAFALPPKKKIEKSKPRAYKYSYDYDLIDHTHIRYIYTNAHKTAYDIRYMSMSMLDALTV
jgi:hypothetical protein